MNEPHQAAGAEDRGDEKVQPQAEDVMSGVDAQEFLEDAKPRVAGDVEGEQPGRADLASAAQPDEGAGEREVPDQLVEKRRLKRGEVS